MSAGASSHTVAAVAHLPAGDYVLEVKSASITLDNSWIPYGQISLVCVRPPESVLEELDPREDNVRVTVTATRKTGPYIGDTGSGLAHLWESEYERVFDVLLVARSAGASDRTIVVRCDTDEALLLGDALLETTPDSYPFSIQDSLREIIDYVLDRHDAELYNPGGPPFDPANEEGEADASLWYYADETNLITNPSGETNTTGWATAAVTLASVASAVSGKSGSNILRMSAPSSSLSYVRSDPITVTPGKTYIARGGFTMNGVAASGTVDATRARRIQIVNVADSASLALSNQAPATVGATLVPLELEVTIPAGVTSIWVRVWLGSTVGTAYFDSVKFCEKSAVLDPYEYFDGASTDTDLYVYSWTGTAHNSTSKRTTVDGVSADLDAFTWEPGVTAWDFLEPLVQAAGLRLYCDEARRWHLVDVASVPASNVTVSENVNLVAADESISRYDEWFDAVVVRYSWSTAAGVSKVRYDVATEVVGTPKAVLRIDENRPYPGPGYAAAVLHRAEGRGRVFGLTALSDYRVTPGDALEAIIPDTPEQNGRVSAVTWELPGKQMTIRSSGLIDVSPTAWIELAGGVAWTASPVGESWLEETA